MFQKNYLTDVEFSRGAMEINCIKIFPGENIKAITTFTGDFLYK